MGISQTLHRVTWLRCAETLSASRTSMALGERDNGVQSDQPIAETQYERNQRFNALVAWLHSLRYKNILKVVAEASSQARGRRLRIVDIGCAHAKLFAVLNERFPIDYTGIDLSPISVKAARARYGGHANFRILQDSVLNALPQMRRPDLVVALETFEHIPEHDVVRVVESLAELAPGRFVCSVPVEIGPAIWLKNVGSRLLGYPRHREYTWWETLWAGLYRLDRLPPHGTGHKGFDWRWLAQTIRHNMRITRLRRFPFNFIPAPFASSIFMVAEPR